MTEGPQWKLSTLLPRACLRAQTQPGICFFFGLFLAATSFVAGQTPPARPLITGIDRVHLYVSDLAKASDFYSKNYGVRLLGGGCYAASDKCFTIGWRREQAIEVEEPKASLPQSLLASVTLGTDNVKRMREFLISRGLSPSKISDDKFEKQVLASHFDVADPEGNRISFIQRFAYAVDDPGPGDQAFVQIIHAGFVVRDRAAEDKFYKDILGFHLYWQGGRQDGQTDWVNMQVPDGTDWIEYMLNIPPDADHKRLGVANHIALGVPDIHAAQKMLIDNGAKLTEDPKIGRGGKWQLNVYDPDDTRIEFMEFTPVQKPCCSEYTGPHPKP